MEGDDRTFGVNYSTDGVIKLREAVTEKLKEFMGDYTDDTLVEYVIVLLKNGRRKDEAKNELDVFLGDDSHTFVSWLWDHLGSNINLYLEQDHQLGEPITQSTLKRDIENEMNPVELKARRENSDTTLGHSEKLQQKALARDLVENKDPHRQNSVGQQDEFERKNGRSDPSDSHRPTRQKKRRHSEEKRPSKTEVIESTASASRRLLQSAVRDAVAKSHPSKSSERSLKRLRSVISTSTGDTSLEERPRRIPRTSMSAAIKAVAEAAEDVRKPKSTRSVFDRLGRGTEMSDAVNYHQEEYGGVAEDLGSGDYYVQKDALPSTYDPQNSGRPPHMAVPSIHDVMMPSDLGYEGEAYDGMYNRGQVANEIDGFGTSFRSMDEKSQSYHPSTVAAAENANGRLVGAHKGSRQPATEPKAFLRIDSSLDMSTRKSQYREEKRFDQVKAAKFLLGSDATANKSKEWSMNERSSTVAVNGKERPDHIPQPSQATQTAIGLANAARPLEDVDSRTIFVNNVHFAATKDNLSRHFSKFGEVLKVTTLTDLATGIPKGSAYIEFARNEAAELALSLNGTSFMSRILKIVKKSSAPSETAPITPRPSIIPRSSSFPVPKYGRPPFPRAVTGPYRGGRGVSMRPAARSFQWKRDAEPTSNQGSVVPPQLPNRSMTYVRPEPKE